MELLDTKVIVALIAAVVSFVGLIITKEQKTSEFRQAWINTLRDEISKFIGQVDSVSKLVLLHKTSEPEKQKESSKAVILDSVKLREIQSKIVLLINAKEDKHNRLVILLNDIINNIKQSNDNGDNIQSLIELTQQILKEEWNRVKEGEPIFKISKWLFGLTIICAMLYMCYVLLCG